MVVQAAWPGATVERHARADHRPPRAQAPGDAEPRLPEELHDRRPRHDLRQPEGLDAAGPGAGHLVPGAQEGGRHPQHAAARHRRPRLQRRVRRHLRHRLRLHRGRLHPSRAAGLRATTSASSCSSCRTSPRSTSSGAQDERVYVEFSTEQLAGLGIDRTALIAALQAPERRHPGGRGADRRREDPGPRLRRVPLRAGRPGHQLRRRTAG